MDREPEEEDSLGGLATADDEPQASSSQEPLQQPQNVYWLAQYFTEEKDNGIWLMALKYPADWPKEKVEKSAKDVRAGDKYAAKDIPLVIKKVSNTSALPAASETTSDWTVKYRVYDSPTRMNSKTVRLNYSSVFTEDQVRAHADRAMGNHDKAVPGSLVISRVDSDSSMGSADELYPLLEDKDWLKKMTQIEQAPKRTGTKRKGSVLCPSQGQTEEEANPDAQPSTSKKSKEHQTDKERYKGKVYKVTQSSQSSIFKAESILLRTRRVFYVVAIPYKFVFKAESQSRK